MSNWSPEELAGRVPTRIDERRLHLRTLPCSCGASITADPENPGPAVVEHVRSAWHVGWWNRLLRGDRE